jgi:hypothetical protein
MYERRGLKTFETTFFTVMFYYQFQKRYGCIGQCVYILLHIRFPGEHDLCILLHFHGNVTVLLRNSEFVTFPW